MALENFLGRHFYQCLTSVQHRSVIGEDIILFILTSLKCICHFFRGYHVIHVNIFKIIQFINFYVLEVIMLFLSTLEEYLCYFFIFLQIVAHQADQSLQQKQTRFLVPTDYRPDKDTCVLGCSTISTFQQQQNSSYPLVSLWGIYKPDPKALPLGLVQGVTQKMADQTNRAGLTKDRVFGTNRDSCSQVTKFLPIPTSSPFLQQNKILCTSTGNGLYSSLSTSAPRLIHTLVCKKQVWSFS